MSRFLDWISFILKEIPALEVQMPDHPSLMYSARIFAILQSPCIP
jgi:hypothetical protein